MNKILTTEGWQKETRSKERKEENQNSKITLTPRTQSQAEGEEGKKRTARTTAATNNMIKLIRNTWVPDTRAGSCTSLHKKTRRRRRKRQNELYPQSSGVLRTLNVTFYLAAGGIPRHGLQ